jgi:uncharacterized protein with HEPN domain
MPKRNDALLLADIAEAARSVFEYVGDMDFEAFINDKKTVDAVVRNFEIIGEAAKLISDETKAQLPLADWREMTDFRNVLIHEYFGIDHEILWDVLKTMLPYNYELLVRFFGV